MVNIQPTSTEFKLIVSQEFNAPRESVWQAWTDPAQIGQWISLGKDVTAASVTMDLRVGGKFRIQTKLADGEFYTAAGTYLEIHTGEKLVYTWDWEKDGASAGFEELEGRETQVTVEFQAIGEKTRLTLTHEKFDAVERRDRHEAGWSEWIDRLGTFLDASAAKRPQ